MYVHLFEIGKTNTSLSFNYIIANTKSVAKLCYKNLDIIKIINFPI